MHRVRESEVNDLAATPGDPRKWWLAIVIYPSKKWDDNLPNLMMINGDSWWFMVIHGDLWWLYPLVTVHSLRTWPWPFGSLIYPWTNGDWPWLTIEICKRLQHGWLRSTRYSMMIPMLIPIIFFWTRSPNILWNYSHVFQWWSLPFPMCVPWFFRKRLPNITQHDL